MNMQGFFHCLRPAMYRIRKTKPYTSGAASCEIPRGPSNIYSSRFWAGRDTVYTVS